MILLMDFENKDISLVLKAVMELEQERERPFYPVEVASASDTSVETSRKILSLLERMGIVKSTFELTHFGKDIQEMPEEE